MRSRNFEARNGRVESNKLVKNQRKQRRVHKGQGECWQWQAYGQCSKGDKCRLRHDEHKRAKSTTQPAPSPEHSTHQDGKIQRERKVPEAEVHLVECLDGPARITLKVLPRFHLVKSGILQNACSTGQKDGCKFGKSALSHTAGLRNNPVKGQKGMATKVQCLCLNRERIWVVFQDVEPPRSSSILRKISTVSKPIRCVRFTKAVLRKANDRDQNPPTECAQEILISAAPTQNLRIGLRKRRHGKSIGLAKQRGSWQRKS